MLGRRVVVFGLLIAVGAFGVGCGEANDDGATTASAEPSATAGNPYDTARCHRYCQPPAIEGSSAVFTSSSVIEAATGQWSVSGPRLRTIVQAGAVAYHPAAGLLLILRLDRSKGNEVGERVKIPGAGVLTITDAPSERSVMLSSQGEGLIKFKNAKGITGTLNLADDRVVLSCPGMCPRVRYQRYG